MAGVAAVGVPWVPAVVMFYTVAGVHAAAIVLTAVDINSVCAVAGVLLLPPSLLLLTFLLLLVFPMFLVPLLLLATLLLLASRLLLASLPGISTGSGIHAVVGVPCSSCCSFVPCAAD
jgi:hypothetical protein